MALQDNGTDTIILSSDGGFTFPVDIASGSSYSVSVTAQPTGQTCAVGRGTGTVNDVPINNLSVTCTPNNYVITGSVAGLINGRSLVLVNNGSDNTSLSANGPFGFSTLVASGSDYAVTVLTQPAGQSCAVTNGSGTVAASDIGSVTINCSDDTYNIGFTVSRLSASGLVLQDNGGDNLSVSTSGASNFNTPVASGSNYLVTVLSQPLGESCAVGNGGGTVISSNITNVTVSCTPNVYRISGMVNGLLSGRSLGLLNNGINNMTVSANGNFTFSTLVASGLTYAVTVYSQPAGQSCTVTNGSGTVMGSAVANVSVLCSDNTYNISVGVSGLLRSGLVLQDDGGDSLSVSTNGTVNFNTPVASGSPYLVTILTQPPGESCLVTSGSGTVTSTNVNVAVACTPNTYSIGGSVSGLVGSLILQNNGTDNVAVSANGIFTFATPISSGATYAVTVVTQPVGQNCSAANVTGIVTVANVTNVVVSCAMSNAWTWASGSNTIDSDGVYGTQGIAGITNVPGARYLSVSWTDLSGNLWLFGGAGYVPGGASGYLQDLRNDLWMFNPTATTWTWINGSNTINANGIYGTRGIAAAGNVPGARRSANARADASGNLWLFGGIGSSGWLNDLWKFNPTVGVWTWVSGSNTPDTAGVYGAQAIAGVGNSPGSRVASVCWIDSSGNFWLFGGIGYDSQGNYGVLNDVWLFNTTAGTWTWVGGSNTINANGVYGTLGTAAVGNVPGARNRATSWIDSSGNFWLFGGYGYDTSGSISVLNDLWKLDPTAGTWTWVAGSKVVGALGVYGTQGMSAAGNVPGARYDSVSWTDASGDLWLFGGQGFSSNAQGILNDLWKFNPTSGTWTWVNGSNTALVVTGIYGVKGIAAASNVPGARISAVSWTDAAGHLWLFGGDGYDSTGAIDLLNDLWEFVP